MKLASIAAVIALGLSTSACVIIDADDVRHEPVTVQGSGQPLDPLMAARVDGADLVVRVSSNGCTRQEDFSVETQRRDGLTSFSFVRKRPDNCRALIAEGWSCAIRWTRSASSAAARSACATRWCGRKPKGGGRLTLRRRSPINRAFTPPARRAAR